MSQIRADRNKPHSLTMTCICREGDIHPGANPACPIHGLAGHRLAQFFDAIQYDQDQDNPEGNNWTMWKRAGYTPNQFATWIYMEEHWKASEDEKFATTDREGA